MYECDRAWEVIVVHHEGSSACSASLSRPSRARLYGAAVAGPASPDVTEAVALHVGGMGSQVRALGSDKLYRLPAGSQRRSTRVVAALILLALGLGRHGYPYAVLMEYSTPLRLAQRL